MRLRKRLPLPVVIAVVGGLLIAAAGLVVMFNMAPWPPATARVPVPARDIPALTEITARDLEWRVIPVGGFEPGAARDPGQAVGKVSLVTLYRGEQIALSRLEDRTLLDTDRRVMALNINLVRSGGGAIRPGDTVDVYWLSENRDAALLAGTGPALAYVPGALLASSAMVLAIRDAGGRDTSGEESQALILGQTASPALPALVLLAVNSGDVAQVVRGAGDGSKGIVLVKKLK